MSSDMLQSAVVAIQQSDYLSVALVAAVGYDYVLTFSSEIEHIWSKPWTWVSTLYIPVRYLGLFNLMVSALLGTSLIPGPAKTCQIIGIINAWTFLLFYAAAEFVMILRIWAMYNRSRVVIGCLLALYFVVIIGTILDVIVNSIPKDLPAGVVQILDISFCTLASTVPTWTNVAVILQVTQGGILCLLGIVQVVKQSLQMYRATKAWQVNRYMALLVKQGMLSFLAILLFNLVNVLYLFGKAPIGGWQLLLLVALEYVPIYTLTPRFILSMREMYARNTQKPEGIDTAFGLSVAGTTMEFVAAGQDRCSEDIEEIAREVQTTKDV
ncbi:hypothetical protein EV363DRAFT_1322397 [Boletus edulis]|nr:hypothetical protein EV363DRAFT_1322397 [Boletus edulis]